MAWEKVAHDLAKEAGIVVPESTLLSIDGRHVHIIDRFDRVAERRVGCISAMTMIEANDGEFRSYLEIASAIEEQSSQTTRDLHELWRRIAFSVLISNTDDHPRNHAFLRTTEAGWTLAPAFDLNPNPEPGPKELSCAIDDTDPAATIENVRRVAPLFRLNELQAQNLLGEVADAVSQWREVAARIGLSESETDEMALAFDEQKLTAAYG